MREKYSECENFPIKEGSMPARKLQSLNQSHQTKEEKSERESGEAAMTPVTQIDIKPPALLQKHPHAKKTWTRLIGLYFEVDGTIVTAFDADLLVKYCLLEEECLWWEARRAALEKNIARVDKLLANKEKAKDLDAKSYLELMSLYNALNARVQGFDARLDAKRALQLKIAQSLYLTPRSRAGVAPTSKPKENEDGFGSEFD
jgi:phage terminase small subunit